MTPLEHVVVTVEFFLDRPLHTEVIRHRLASPNVSSTRYIRFGSEKFGGKVKFVQPDYKYAESVIEWLNHCAASVDLYNTQLERGEDPEMARGVLPLSLGVNMVLTANIREWRHIFKVRATKAAHPQLAKLMTNLLKQFQTKYPVLFDDIKGEVDAE